MVLQFIEIFPHPGVDRTIPPLHRKPGFDHIPVLHYIIRHQTSARRKQTHDLRQEVDILSFRRIHKDKIIGPFKRLQHLSGIALDQGDPVLFSGTPEIIPRNRDPLPVVFDGSDPASGRDIFAHQQC